MMGYFDFNYVTLNEIEITLESEEIKRFGNFFFSSLRN
jgi:hypothetical protein